ncbi:bifunctional riboflavin kinase/FAD synthetase [Paenibacillaceae bacterium]|nr:bifunctional riboflavin kinase/FAD synthetase [Paenibacillaceae bacterium]
MEIISLSYPLTDEAIKAYAIPQTLAIGHFDGVHKGHQQVIRKAVAVAREHGWRAAVMTFHPHPKEVISQGETYITCLTPLDEKMKQFAELGVEVAYVFRFDPLFAQAAPSQFVEEVLRQLQVKCAVVGFDFRFGYQGSGDAAVLQSLGESFMQVEVVEACHRGGEKISSTLVRQLLAEGNVEEAELLLGRSYTMAGVVVHGDGRGSKIGYPTANIELEGAYALPRLGVYAVTASFGEERCLGVMNIGVKPTFVEERNKPTVEVHLFDFDRDIYGTAMQIEVRRFIRSERKFTSVDELIAQISKDAGEARRLLTETSPQSEDSVKSL